LIYYSDHPGPVPRIPIEKYQSVCFHHGKFPIIHRTDNQKIVIIQYSALSTDKRRVEMFNWISSLFAIPPSNKMSIILVTDVIYGDAFVMKTYPHFTNLLIFKQNLDLETLKQLAAALVPDKIHLFLAAYMDSVSDEFGYLNIIRLADKTTFDNSLYVKLGLKYYE